jgi:hypothetical protein
MHTFGIQPTSFGLEYVVVQPTQEREIIGQASKQRHSCMGMGVHQPGHDDASTGIYNTVGFRERLIGWRILNALQVPIGYTHYTSAINIEVIIDC